MSTTSDACFYQWKEVIKIKAECSVFICAEAIFFCVCEIPVVFFSQGPSRRKQTQNPGYWPSLIVVKMWEEHIAANGFW